jgi:hypothetical protein
MPSLVRNPILATAKVYLERHSRQLTKRKPPEERKRRPLNPRLGRESSPLLSSLPSKKCFGKKTPFRKAHQETGDKKTFQLSSLNDATSASTWISSVASLSMPQRER